MNGGIRRATSDKGQLSFVDVWMFLRSITVQDGKRDGPHQTQQGKRVEHRAPAKGRHDGNGDERRHRDREPAETMCDPLNETTLLFGKPKLHGARRGWKCAGFTKAEYEANAEERE